MDGEDGEKEGKEGGKKKDWIERRIGGGCRIELLLNHFLSHG